MNRLCIFSATRNGLRLGVWGQSPHFFSGVGYQPPILPTNQNAQNTSNQRLTITKGET